MTVFKIDKGGKPMPPERNGRAPIYPFHDMEIGDSFDAPRDMGKNEKGSDRRQHAVKCASVRHGQMYGKDFDVRCIDEYTVRCKRIA